MLGHAERDAYLYSFVDDYNRTRLRCLDYQAPAEVLAKLAGHNTKAGVAVGLSLANHHANLPVAYRLYLPED